MTLGLIEDPWFLKHDSGPGHPERPERLTAIAATVQSLPFQGDIKRLAGRDATRAELELVHEPPYLDLLEASKARELTVFDADTRAGKWSYAAALRAAGSAVVAVEQSLEGTARRSFVAGRPPGHHAEAGRAMGFCLMNNAAIAAAAAVRDGGLERVAVVDWDVHHGNGTANIFCDRSDVLYISMHQYPHYPGTGAAHETGAGDGRGFTVNLPLPAGCTDTDYLFAMDTVILPILRQYRPQLMIVSAGFDAHQNDPLSGMQLTARGFALLTRRLTEIADEYCGGRIVHLLEGGYDLEGLAESARAVLTVLAGGDVPPEDRRSSGPHVAGVRPDATAAVRLATSHLSRYWSLPVIG